MPDPDTINVFVYGQVQGVGFRAATAERARQLSLAGWVANCADGSVQVVASGDPGSIRAFTHWLENGPPAARVDRLDSRPAPDDNLTRPFSVLG